MSEARSRLLDDQYLALRETYATSPVVSDARLAVVTPPAFAEPSR